MSTGSSVESSGSLTLSSGASQNGAGGAISIIGQESKDTGSSIVFQAGLSSDSTGGSIQLSSGTSLLKCVSGTTVIIGIQWQVWEWEIATTFVLLHNLIILDPLPVSMIII